MRPLVAVVLVLAALVIGQWPLLRDIHVAWMDPYGAYSHGYLVLGLALVLAVRQWRSPPRLAPVRPCWAALPVLAALMVASIALDRLFVGGIRSLLLPPLLICALAVGAGLPSARRLLGPVAFLYVALPVWSPVNGMLQSLTTHAAGAVLKVLGVPVFLEGNFVHLPSGTFEIAAGCSGLNYFLAALTMGAFASAFLVDGWKRRLAIMGVAAALGIVANWIRVMSLVVIGHRTQMQHYLIRVDHLWFGWVIFLLAMVPVVLLARRYSGSDEEDETAVQALGEPATSGVRGVAGTLLVLALLMAPFVVPGRSAAGPMPELPFEEIEFPSGWSPGFVGASISRDMVRDPVKGTVVEIVRARYDRQRPEARISLYRNTTRGGEWSEIESRKVEGPVGRGLVTEHEGLVGGRKSLVWDWYVVAGTPVASSKSGYRLRELRSLLSRRRDADIIAIFSNCEGSCEAARAALSQVADQLLKTGDLTIPSQFFVP
jgi:exosortase